MKHNYGNEYINSKCTAVPTCITVWHAFENTVGPLHIACTVIFQMMPVNITCLCVSHTHTRLLQPYANRAAMRHELVTRARARSPSSHCNGTNPITALNDGPHKISSIRQNLITIRLTVYWITGWKECARADGIGVRLFVVLRGQAHKRSALYNVTVNLLRRARLIPQRGGWCARCVVLCLCFRIPAQVGQTSKANRCCTMPNQTPHKPSAIPFVRLLCTELCLLRALCVLFFLLL